MNLKAAEPMKNVKNMVQIVILAALSLMLQQIATKTMKNGFDRECHCVFLCISLSIDISQFYLNLFLSETFCCNGVKISRPDKLFVTYFYIFK